MARPRWVLDTAGAKLIDDPAVDQHDVTSGARTPVAAFLLDVMRAARGAAETHPPAARTIAVPPWPLSVHRFLEQLTVAPDMNASSVRDVAEALMRRRSAVRRGWRTLTIVIPLLIPVLWAATTVLQTLLPTASMGRLPWYAAFAMGLTTLVTTLIGVATVALVGAVVFRGGVMRILGLELVTTEGRLASRWRVLARTALAWAPVLLLALITVLGPSIGNAGVSGLLLSLTPPRLLLMLIGAIVAIVNPARGIQDRLAGTWIVPR
jgi:hypothetical protein